jgi:hypothetical protein
MMIFSLKRLGYDPVGSSVKSRWSIDIDLKFFSNLRSAYKQVRGNKVIPFLNAITFYIVLVGACGLPILAALSELW